MGTAINFLKTAFVVVTGASRGIGRQIALDVSKKLCEGSEIVLMARSGDGLKETSNIITSACNDKVKVTTEIVDLSNFTLEEYESMFSKLLSANTQYESGVIFHNAGSMGTMKKVTAMSDLDVWKKYYELNFFSTIVINNVFIKEVTPLTKKVYVINITSMCGRKPFPVMAMYGSVKAARELYFRVLNVDEPTVVVLQYSPGAVKTNMTALIADHAEDDNLRKQFKEMIDQKTILTPKTTVEKLLTILECGDFKSGDVIDYYDRE